jgi:hypothetical protein
MYSPMANTLRPAIRQAKREVARGMVYLAMADLGRRWIYSRRGLQKLMRRSGFPEPFITANQGRIKLWHMSDVAAYEAAHPELTSEEAKRRKVSGFARARRKGQLAPA